MSERKGRVSRLAALWAVVAAAGMVLVPAGAGPASAQQPTPYVIVGGWTGIEGHGLRFAVGFTPPLTADAQVGWRTVDGTATAGEDYTAASGTVTVPAGRDGYITVQSIDDTIVEDSEWFFIEITSRPADTAVSYMAYTDYVARGVILSDDAGNDEWWPRVGVTPETVVPTSTGMSKLYVKLNDPIATGSEVTVTPTGYDADVITVTSDRSPIMFGGRGVGGGYLVTIAPADGLDLTTVHKTRISWEVSYVGSSLSKVTARTTVWVNHGDASELYGEAEHDVVSVAEGSTATVRLRLDAEPDGPVPVELAEVLVYSDVNGSLMVHDDLNRSSVDIAAASPATVTFTPQNWNTWQSVAIPTTTDTDSHEDCSILTIKPVHLENEGGIIWGPLFDVCATEASTAPMSGQMSEPTEPGEMIWPPVQFLSEAASQFYESAETAPATWQRISPEVTSRTATSLDLSWAPSPGADGYDVHIWRNGRKDTTKQVIKTATTQATAAGLTPGKLYVIRVHATASGERISDFASRHFTSRIHKTRTAK